MALYTFTAYTGIYLISLVISILVMVIAWNKRQVRTSSILSLMMLGVSIWTLAGVFEVSAIPAHLKIFWSKMEYIGGTATPVLFFLFTLDYSKNEKWINTRNTCILFVIPVIEIFLVFTNEYHGLIWNGFKPGPEGTNSLIYIHGRAFWILYIFYSYILLLAGTVLLFRTSASLPHSLRLQTIFIIAALIFPWAASILYISRLNPLPGLELTRVSFMFTGLLLSFAILRLKLLELSPIARSILIDTMSDGIIVLDDFNRIVDINPSACRLVIKPGQNLVGKTIQEIVWESETLKDFLESSPLERIEITTNTPDLLCYEISKVPLVSYRNKLYGHLITIHDLTVRKKLEMSLAENTRQLREANVSKDNFFTLLSHDLRTPLGTIRSLAEILNTETDNLPKAKKQKLVSSIYSASEQTYLLLESLLEWAKQHTGQIGFNPEVINLKHIVNESFAQITDLANLKNIRISHDVDSTLGAYADRTMISTVLRNLLSNAIKFTPKGGMVKVSAEIDAHGSNGKMIKISVTDTGIGISQQNQEKLFRLDKKFSIRGTDNEKGSGFGLILCKELVERNHGNISVKSEEGSGSSVWFTLPLPVN